MTVFVAGASGFIGRALIEVLPAAQVVAGVRSVTGGWPAGTEIRSFDLDNNNTVAQAMTGCRSAFFLVHGMANHHDYAAWEQRTAATFATAAADMGVERIIYLGGVVPKAGASTHLQARARTGEALRNHHPNVIELRAGMIVGPGSASHRCVRDLVTRLPVLPLPMWASHRQAPIALVDVLAALVRSLDAEVSAGVYDLAGPDVWRHVDVMQCAADVLHSRIRIMLTKMPIPIRMIAPIAAAISSAPAAVIRELVQGLPADLLGSEVDFFASWLPQQQRQSLSVAFAEAERTLRSQQSLSLFLAEAGMATIASQLRRVL